MENHWSLIDKYYSEYGLRAFTKHHTVSYNTFVHQQVRKTIAALNPVEVSVAGNMQIWVGGRDGSAVSINRPSHRPQECRDDNKSYVADVRVKLLFVYETTNDKGESVKNEQEIDNVPLCTLPVMVGSDMCLLKTLSTAAKRAYGEDLFDLGGYFIVSGKEKVVVSQERNAPNRVFVSGESKNPAYAFKATLRSVDEEGESLFPRVLNMMVYSEAYRDGARRNAIAVSLVAFKDPVPLFVLFRALGVTSDRDIVRFILGDVHASANASQLQFLHASLVDGNFVYTQYEALEYLNGIRRSVDLKISDDKHKHDIILLALATDLFPGTGADMRAKAMYLGDAVNTLVQTCTGSIAPLNRDNVRYKRVDVSGALMSDLFRDSYAYYAHNARNVLESTYLYNFKGQSAEKLITPATVNRAFDAALMNNNLLGSLKGKWRTFKSTTQTGDDMMGVSQEMSRVTFMGTTSHLRRVNTPLDESAKVVGPHYVQGSHFGLFCPTESPDGASIGLLKHLALLAHVSPDCDGAAVRKLIAPFVTPLHHSDVEKSLTKVRFNGVWMATCEDPKGLAEWVRLHKRNGLVSPFVSVAWMVLRGEVLINTDSGRVCRPLLIVQDGSVQDFTFASTWTDLIRGRTLNESDAYDIETQRGYVSATDALGLAADTARDTVVQRLRENQAVVEFVDAEESENCMIASSPAVLKDAKHMRFTHCEIHPSMMLSTVTALLPFSNHTGAARNVLSCAQSKQGVGVYAMNFRSRMDNMCYVLHYPQRPIVTTRHYHYQRQDVLGHGQNAIVAIAAYSGYNQEDAVIINKTSVDRGLLTITYYKTIEEEETIDMSGTTRIEFGNPEVKQAEGMAFEGTAKGAGLDTIDDYGFPRVGARVRDGDVLLGKYDTVISEVKDPNWERSTRKITHSDRSLVADQTIDGVVDRVHVFRHDSKNKLSTCKIRLRQVRPPTVGDKTGSRHSQKGCIGALIPAEEMPYTKDGIVPDIIINPGGFPKRMTVAQLMEAVMSKLGCTAGALVDSTAFEKVDVEACCEVLEKRYNGQRYGEDILYNGVTGQQMQAQVYMTPMYSQRLKHMVLDKINARARGGSTALTRQPNKGRSNGGGLRIGEMETNALLGHGVQGFLRESFMQRSDGYRFGVDSRGALTAPSDADKTSVIEMPYSMKLLAQEVMALNIGVRFDVSTDDAEEVDEDATILESEEAGDSDAESSVSDGE